MADRWTLIPSVGDPVVLNPSFFAEQYEVGEVDEGALRLRDDEFSVQRVGDALRTPAPFVLQGRVWGDDQDYRAVRGTVNAINAAVLELDSIQRTTGAGVFTYSRLNRAAQLEVVEDGANQFVVKIVAWPSSSAVAFEPSLPCVETLGWRYPDTPFAPAQTPVAFQAGAFVVHQDRLILIGGTDATGAGIPNSVRAYSFPTDTWATLTNIGGAGVSSFYPIRAASIGDWVYAHNEFANNFYRYNPSTGVTETLTGSGTYDGGVVAVGGLIYRNLAGSGAMLVYNPGTDSWGTALGSRPSELAGYSSAAMTEDGSSIIVSVDQAPSTEAVWRYTPSSGAWVALPLDSVQRFAPGLVRFGGALYRIGADSYWTWTTFSRLADSASAWVTEALPVDDRPNVVWAVAAAGSTGILVVGGYGTDGGVENQNDGSALTWGLLLRCTPPAEPPDDDDEGPILIV
jgi:hypothetical protein